MSHITGSAFFSYAPAIMTTLPDVMHQQNPTLVVTMLIAKADNATMQMVTHTLDLQVCMGGGSAMR